MPRKALLVCFVLLLFVIPAFAQESHTPQLLLSAQRLRRLKRDHDRKTTRWSNFENRVNSVPDSPERGFELALYYVITGDEAKGRDAIAWVLSHNSQRQSALVSDWCASLLSEDQKKKLAVAPSAFGQFTFQVARDGWFRQVASDGDIKAPEQDYLRPQLSSFMGSDYRNAEEFYALCELLYTVRAATRTDLREMDAHFFATLPALLLLSAKPRELNSPSWQMHAAALALVAIDPNLPASQFLQSWALEDSQTMHDGPGVAYELLWADPYLPGVGYQNMDTWAYDEHGNLFARSDWESNSCWIRISPQGVNQENCPPNWQRETVTFGHLVLIPATERCFDVPRNAPNGAVMVWKLTPGQKLTYGKGKDQRTVEADSTGIWRAGSTVDTKVCLSQH